MPSAREAETELEALDHRRLVVSSRRLWLLAETEPAPAESGLPSLSLDRDSESIVDAASLTYPVRRLDSR